jgi:D-threo-aldose 1-dehydrogenase
VRAIEATCKAYDVALPTAALQFLLAHPAVVSIIPGATRENEVNRNIASLAVSIPAAFWADLKDRNLIDKYAPVPVGS